VFMGFCRPVTNFEEICSHFIHSMYIPFSEPNCRH
jgi:hypothetical protein